MLARHLPEILKGPIRGFIQKQVGAWTPQLYYPSHAGAAAYHVPVRSHPTARVRGDALPVPPEDLWVGYGADAQAYLDSGMHDVDVMCRALESAGLSVAGAARVLELGCAAGRMIRHFPNRAPAAELWGVDISARHIRWCIDHLSPTIRFCTSTVIPHLPFEDRYFDLVFCGSVFTHVEDTAETWLQELGRILRPGGMLYLTLHDEHTVMLLDTRYRDHWLAKSMLANPTYRDHRHDFGMIVLGRREGSQVFYHSDYFRSVLPPCFRVVSYEPESYGYQSGVTLARR